MDFEQLEDLLAIVNEGTYLQASLARDITQSTLTKRMQKLEAELGFPLFQRQGRSSVLTREGKLFLPYAEKLVATRDEALRALSEEAETIRIGTLPVLSQYHLLEKLNAFASGNGLKLSITELEETELERSHSSYDLIIAREDILDDRLYSYQVLQEDVLAAVLRKDHPLSALPKLTLEEIQKEPLLMMKSYTAVHQRTLKEFRRRGLEPRIVLSGRLESILEGASQGNGLALLPLSSYPLFHSHGTIAIAVPEVPLTVGLLRKRGKALSENETRLARSLRS